MIAALLGSECALAVTEPTPLGAHDLDLILTLTKKLKIKTQVVLNRSDIGVENIIQKVVKNHQTKIIAKIPYSQEIEKKYCAGIPIEHKAIEKIIQWIKK